MLGTVIPSSKPAICENSPVPSHTEHETKGHIRLSVQGMEVQPSWDVASQTTRPSAEVTPGSASPSFGLGKGWHTAERKPGQEEPLGQMLKGNQVSGEGRQGQAAGSEPSSNRSEGSHHPQVSFLSLRCLQHLPVPCCPHNHSAYCPRAPPPHQERAGRTIAPCSHGLRTAN